MSGLLSIETSRLQLRKLEPADAAALLRIYADPAVVRFMRPARVTEIEEAVNIQRHAHQYYTTRGFGLLAGVLKATNTLVGRYGLLYSTIDGFQEIEVSYLTDPDHRGLGFAVEAVQGILDAVWRSGLMRVVAVVLPENVASQRVAESAGFSYERDVQYKDFGTVRLYGAGPR